MTMWWCILGGSPHIGNVIMRVNLVRFRAEFFRGWILKGGQQIRVGCVNITSLSSTTAKRYVKSAALQEPIYPSSEKSLKKWVAWIPVSVPGRRGSAKILSILCGSAKPVLKSAIHRVPWRTMSSVPPVTGETIIAKLNTGKVSVGAYTG